MAFTAMAGSHGRLKAVVVAPSLAVPVPTLTGLSTANVAGIRSWKVRTKHEGARSLHFESPVDAAGSVYPEHMQGGVTEWSVEIEGEFDGDSTDSQDWFQAGEFLVFDLILHKTSALGRYQCKGKIMGGPDHGPQVRSTDPQLFTVTIDGHGTLPALTTS